MRFLVGAMMVTLALAGCVDDDSYVPDEADACVVTAADAYDACAAEEEGLTRNEVAHRHDYWQDRERITILDTELSAERLMSGMRGNCEAYAEYTFVPEDGFTVIQGTQYVEITMDWGTETYDQYGPPEVWLKTANMTGLESVGTIQSGQTFVFESTNADNDLPHSLISAWQIAWAPTPGINTTGPCMTTHWSEFSIQVDIVKGLEIPLFPGHPDHWDGGNITEMTILEETRDTFVYYHNPDVTRLCLNGCLWPSAPWTFKEGGIVPYDADRVIIEMDASSDVPGESVGLLYHGADSRTFIAIEPTQVDGTTQIYEIDVDRVLADGPYNRQTLWDVQAYPNGPTTSWNGVIDLKVTVEKDAD